MPPRFHEVTKAHIRLELRSRVQSDHAFQFRWIEGRGLFQVAGEFAFDACCVHGRVPPNGGRDGYEASFRCLGIQHGVKTVKNPHLSIDDLQVRKLFAKILMPRIARRKQLSTPFFLEGFERLVMKQGKTPNTGNAGSVFRFTGGRE